MHNEKDSYELVLEAKKEELQVCQKEKKLTSCMPCEYFFTCKIRGEYVRAVYESMNKGQSGGFEF
ncbi:MAG: hypothetical protein IBX44_06630 [Sulfurospirillum sp.]|nr:hypothetical protein [Sulfurospirillum sp.]